MGWLDDRYGAEHEGFVIALITREDGYRGSGLYRKLRAPNDRDDVDIERLGTECGCGWRSPHWDPLRRQWTGTDGDHFILEWAPFSPIVSPDDDERAFREWKRHVADVASREAESTEPYPQLRVVPDPAPQTDDPATHICAAIDEPRCWLRRRLGEDGSRASAQPCDEYRTFCTAPGYCWCGHLKTRHASWVPQSEERDPSSAESQTGALIRSATDCLTCSHKPVRATRAIWVHRPKRGVCRYVAFCEDCARRQRDVKRPADCSVCKAQLSLDVSMTDYLANRS